MAGPVQWYSGGPPPRPSGRAYGAAGHRILNGVYPSAAAVISTKRRGGGPPLYGNTFSNVDHGSIIYSKDIHGKAKHLLSCRGDRDPSRHSRTRSLSVQ
jgi:hypothetical protein